MARRRGLAGNRIAVELIVPDDIKQLAIVDLIERGAERIGGGIADASAALFQRAVLAAGKSELLAEILLFLYGPAEQACPLSGASARGKRLGIELEDELPVDGLTIGQ